MRNGFANSVEICLDKGREMDSWVTEIIVSVESPDLELISVYSDNVYNVFFFLIFLRYFKYFRYEYVYKYFEYNLKVIKILNL